MDAQGGVVYFTQSGDQSAGVPACLGQVSESGGDGVCIDLGGVAYSSVRADDAAVYFTRDASVMRIWR